MKNYDPNISWGTHVIEVTFQQWDFTGKLSYEVGGNTKGSSHFEDVADHICWAENFLTNDCKLKIDDDWFSVVLTNPSGEELLIEDEVDFLDNMIVGVRIVSFKEDNS